MTMMTMLVGITREILNGRTNRLDFLELDIQLGQGNGRIQLRWNMEGSREGVRSTHAIGI